MGIIDSKQWKTLNIYFSLIQLVSYYTFSEGENWKNYGAADFFLDSLSKPVYDCTKHKIILT